MVVKLSWAQFLATPQRHIPVFYAGDEAAISKLALTVCFSPGLVRLQFIPAVPRAVFDAWLASRLVEMTARRWYPFEVEDIEE